jgi:hypothetical protein
MQVFWTKKTLPVQSPLLLIWDRHLLCHAIKSLICFDLHFSRSTRPMTSFCIFIAYKNTEGILLNFNITRCIPEKVMICDDDYINQPER